MSEVLFTNYTNTSKFKNEFKRKLSESDRLIIASGYFGYSTLVEFEKDLINIAKKGDCKILLGMIFHGGVSQKQQDILEKVNMSLRNVNSDSGIFISTTDYHGKIYQFYNSAKNKYDLYLGSSNFSNEGFASRYECTSYIENENLKNEVSQYLDQLFNEKLARRIEDVELRSRSLQVVKPSKLLKDYEIQESDFPYINQSIGVCSIKLRVDEQPESGLNLFFGRGRKNQKGQLTTRPWYEIEIGTSKQDRENPYYPKTKLNAKKDGGKSREGDFIAYAMNDSKYYKFNMKVFADYGKNIATSDLSGGRETLGKFLKGKLEDKGLLKEGEVITSETLMEYGNDTLFLHKLNDTEYIMEF